MAQRDLMKPYVEWECGPCTPSNLRVIRDIVFGWRNALRC